jgi:3-deoxy-D-manno-octulosonate cytidylyltransferase
VSFAVVIPARLGSTRLPRKVLLPIAGRPLVQWVWQAARASAADEVVVATDSEEVAAACRAFGADTCLTSPDHASGTDRVEEVARRRGWSPDAVIVNLQGDEPCMPPALLDQAAALAREADIGTLAHPLHDEAEWRDPNVVKVVCDAQGHALYFSRSPIPHLRGAPEGATRPPGSGLPPHRAVRLPGRRAAALRRTAAGTAGGLRGAGAVARAGARSAHPRWHHADRTATRRRHRADLAAVEAQLRR